MHDSPRACCDGDSDYKGNGDDNTYSLHRGIGTMPIHAIIPATVAAQHHPTETSRIVHGDSHHSSPATSNSSRVNFYGTIDSPPLSPVRKGKQVHHESRSQPEGDDTVVYQDRLRAGSLNYEESIASDDMEPMFNGE